jgi:hypothetical protein
VRVAPIRGVAVALSVVASTLPCRATPADAAEAFRSREAAGFRISLSGRWGRSDARRNSAAGLLTVTIPLDRFAASSWSEPPNRSAASEAHELPLPAASVPVSPEPDAQRPVPAAPRPATTDLGELRAQLSILLDAGLARQTVGAALRAAGFAGKSARLDSLAARARTSAILPDLRIRGGRSTDESIRWSPTVEDPRRYSQAGSAELFFDVQLTWQLDRLVFATAELRVEQLRRQRALAKARLVKRVLEALFAWQRARTKLAHAALLPEEQAEIALSQIEAEAVLDVLTAGWFSRNLEP